MAQEKVYPKGIRCFNRSEKAPDFILGTLIITVPDLIEWVRGEGEQYLSEYQGNAQLKLTVTKSDKTGIGVSVDTWKPNR